MDQKLPEQVNRQSEVAHGWPPTSLLPGEECLVASQSASSALAPADSGDGGELPSNSSLQSTTSLKERDYIGLAEVSSAPSADETQNETGLKLQEPDLRLGLGLPNFDSVERVPEFKEVISIASSQAADVIHVADYVRPPSTITQNGTPLKTMLETIETPQGKTHSSLAQAVSKNSMKRLHAEAMADTHREIALTKNANTVSVRFNSLDSRSSSSSLLSKIQSQDVETKPFSQGARRSTPFISWQFQNDALVNSYSAKPRMNSVPLPSAPAKIEGDGEELRHLSLDLKFCSNGAKVQSCRSERDACDEAPPAKGQVVGWPPVRSYRRSAFVTCPKSSEKEGGSHSAMFVKVNMDGIPVGRKVDLSAYKSYDNLLSALEEMFRNSISGCGAQFSKSADFVLTYEDRDGDWMLVGDVPWDLFVRAVRRLRITRGSEMAGLGLRSSLCQV